MTPEIVIRAKSVPQNITTFRRPSQSENHPKKRRADRKPDKDERDGLRGDVLGNRKRLRDIRNSPKPAEDHYWSKGKSAIDGEPPRLSIF